MNDGSLLADRDELVRRARNILADAFSLGGDMLSSLASVGVSLPKLSLAPSRESRCACGCCGIPETECPPRCVCRMRLAAMTGQTVSARIRVLNEAGTDRVFQLSATPFVSGAEQAEFDLAPSSLNIPAGGSALAIGTLVVPGGFAKGRYQCEILVHGAYEQCVEVELDIGCEEILSGTCTVEQKEKRYRIRAHHWYDHFQCIEPCDCEPEPRDRAQKRAGSQHK